MALYHEVRPATFEGFEGNQAVIDMLTARHAEGKLPHVILISGESGTGKTTLARILATMVGAIPDTVREYNSSNNRGIDTAREIIEEMRYPSVAPIVYILDEFHKGTSDFQNALLKPLEDYPSYVYFFLCTTEPQKAIIAIKTRCKEIALKPLTNDELFVILRKATKHCNKKVPRSVLEAIVEKSKGSARLALVELENIVYSSDEETMLASLDGNMAESSEVIDLCRSLLDGNWDKVRKVISSIVSTDWEGMRYAVLGYMTSVLLKSSNRRAAIVIEFFKEPTYNAGKAGITYAAYMAVTMK